MILGHGAPVAGEQRIGDHAQGAQVRFHHRPHLGQEGVSADFADRAVEGDVGIPEAPDVVLLRRLPHRLDLDRQRLEGGRRRLRGDGPRGQFLDGHAHGAGVVGVLLRHHGHEAAPARDVVGQALVHQAADRLAHRCLADAELAGDLGLDQAGARFEGAVDDQAAHPVVHLVGQQDPRQRLSDGVWHEASLYRPLGILSMIALILLPALDIQVTRIIICSIDSRESSWGSHETQ